MTENRKNGGGCKLKSLQIILLSSMAFFLFAGCESLPGRSIVTIDASVSFGMETSSALASVVMSDIQKEFDFPKENDVSRHGVMLIRKVDTDLGAVVVGNRIEKGLLIRFENKGSDSGKTETSRCRKRRSRI